MLEYLAAYISLQICYKVMGIKAMAYTIPTCFVKAVLIIQLQRTDYVLLPFCFRSIVTVIYSVTN